MPGVVRGVQYCTPHLSASMRKILFTLGCVFRVSLVFRVRSKTKTKVSTLKSRLLLLDGMCKEEQNMLDFGLNRSLFICFFSVYLTLIIRSERSFSGFCNDSSCSRHSTRPCCIFISLCHFVVSSASITILTILNHYHYSPATGNGNATSTGGIWGNGEESIHALPPIGWSLRISRGHNNRELLYV
jgi:hypothetical protein